MENVIIDMNDFWWIQVSNTSFIPISGNPRKPSSDHSAKQSLDDPKSNRKGRKGNTGQTGVDI